MANLTSTPFNVAYLPYLGQASPNPRNTFYRRRAPTNSDRRLYSIGDRWIDTASQIAYILVGKTATTANWVQISGAGGVTSLNGLTGALTIVDQGGAGAITVTVPGSGGPNSIGLSVNVDGVTMQIVGDQLVSNAAAIFNIDAFTAPGTNPVLTTAGMITINGAQVPAASFATGIRTRSIAANQFNIEAQRSSAAAVSTVGLNGISHFNSSMFIVDANGFVSLAGGAIAMDSLVVQAGVSPVQPDGTGQMTFNGAAVAALGIPVQSVGTGANTYELRVQRASAQALSAAANAGLASFNNTQFTVDGNGFVSLTGGGIAIDSVTVNAFTAPGTNPVVPDGAGNITVLGAQVAAGVNPIRTNSIAVNSYEIQVQRSSAQALSTLTANGICHFNNTQFTVDGNGFVSSIGMATFTWVDSAGGALAAFTGYFATAAAAFTLPVAPAQGTLIEIIDEVGGGVVVTSGGGDTIRIGNITSSTPGTATSSLRGDALRLVYRTASASWIECPGSEGIWTLA